MTIDELHIKDLIKNTRHIEDLDILEALWYPEIQLSANLAELFDETRELLLRTSIRSEDD